MSTEAVPSSNPFRAGRRLFATGCVLLLLVAALHTSGGFVRPAPGSLQETLQEEMAGARYPGGFGWTVSQLEIEHAVWFQLSLAVSWIALSGLMVAAWGSELLVRRTTWLAVAVNGATILLAWHYHVLIPLVAYAIVELVLIAGIARGTRADERERL